MWNYASNLDQFTDETFRRLDRVFIKKDFSLEDFREVFKFTTENYQDLAKHVF